jgi:hypothetical protein
LWVAATDKTAHRLGEVQIAGVLTEKTNVDDNLEVRLRKKINRKKITIHELKIEE